MSKYEMPMETMPGSIPAMLMERIAPDMDILEFGCATGRMTRYMKEEKGCRVWIVEVDREAYQIASTYASGGWCGDVEQTDWLEAFAGKKFDRILFADVLEHLRDPDRVLEMAGTLLKEDGEILVSIPNIAHFDILANLAQNRFPYTNLGLLDNTHVHFWGYQDLQPFFEKARLMMTVLDGAYAPPYTTEQDVSTEGISPFLQYILLQMPLHTVYQYFIVAQKTDWTLQSGVRFENRLIPYGDHMAAHFFWDTGCGYQADQRTQLHPEMDENGTAYLRAQIPEGCRRVRFDPIEGSFCLVSRLQAVSDRGICEHAPLNGIRMEELLLFADTDPQIEITVQEGARELELTAAIYPVPERDWGRLFTQVVAAQKAYAQSLRETAQENSRLQAEKSALDAVHAELQAEKSALDAVHANLQAEKSALDAVHAELQAEKSALDAAHANLQAENSIIEAQNSVLSSQISTLTEQLKQSRGEAHVWAAQYYAISNSQCWKMTALLRKFLDAVKRTRWGQLVYKGLRYMRANGFRVAVRKALSYLTANRTASHASLITKPMSSFSALASAFVKGRDTAAYLAKTLASYDCAGKKKVLVLSHELNLTGGPVAVLHLTESLKENGYLPVVVSPHNGLLAHDFEARKIPALVCPQVYTSEVIRQFVGLFDVVIANTIVSAPAVTALYGFSQPIVWWIHEAEVSYHSGALDAMPKSLPDNVYVYAGGAYAKAKLLSHRPAWNVEELHYYVPDLMEGTEPYALPDQAEGKTVFACIGMLEQRKGQEILVQALESLSEERLREGYYIFVGRQCYAPCYERIMALRSRFPQNVEYIQEIPMKAVRQLYHRMDCLICCSLDDPMPIVVTEALALSKLVICSENTGSAAILRADGSGLVYNNDDPQELAGCIARVLEHGDELDSFRKVARRSYETHFSKKVFTQNLLNVMDGLAPAEPEDLSLGKSLTMACPTTENGFSGTVSVVIPAYNAGPTIETLLNRLFSQSGVRKVEVVVIDSGSTDGTPELCRKHGAKVVKISQGEFSHSYSRNLGAKTACGDILLFMTQDAMPVNENWMSNLIEPIISGEASAVSCRDLCPEGTDLYYQIAMWNHWGFVGIRDGDRLYHLEQNETAESLRRKASLNDVTTAIDARVFKKFLYRFNYAEDLDMGLRLLKSGYAIKLLASTQSIHGHNRPAGYYLKRSYVEARTLASIEPQWGVPRQTIDTAARKVTYGAGLLSHALETTLAEQSGPCGLDAFVTVLQKHLSAALEDRLTSGYLSRQDDLLDWCIRTMEPFGRESSPDEAELFHHVCYYLDVGLKPYLLAHGIIMLDKTAQEAICGCLVKQFCMFIGSTLAGLESNEPLYDTIQNIGDGV